MATLIAAQGSTPRRAGARMRVDEAGHVVGSVTIGGCVDARVIEASTRVLADRAPSLLSLSLGDEDAWALGMTCGGTVEVLVEPVDPARVSDPVAGALAAAEASLAAGRRVVLVAALDGVARRLVVGDDGVVAGTLGDPARDAAAAAAATGVLASARSEALQVPVGEGRERLYFEYLAPPLTLVVFGATHVAIPLSEIACTIGLRVIVVDGREQFATRERFPGADELIVGMPSEIASRLPLGPTTLVVLLSHDYKYDLPVLRAVLAADVPYIGLLGSRRRGRALLDFLREDGVDEADLARVRVPVGLDIGARTPEEIALSILAEAIAVERGRSGVAMRDRPAPADGR